MPPVPPSPSTATAAPLPPPPGPPPGFMAMVMPQMVPVIMQQPQHRPKMQPMTQPANQQPPNYRPQLRQVSAAPPVHAVVGGSVGASGAAAGGGMRPRSVAAAAFTKAAAPTVKKILPAQHNPALKALVPASVRIQREKQVLPPSKRQRVLNTAPLKQAPTTGAPGGDDKYLDFLDDMRELGAFE